MRNIRRAGVFSLMEFSPVFLVRVPETPPERITSLFDATHSGGVLVGD